MSDASDNLKVLLSALLDRNNSSTCIARLEHKDCILVEIVVPGLGAGMGGVCSCSEAILGSHRWITKPDTLTTAQTGNGRSGWRKRSCAR